MVNVLHLKISEAKHKGSVCLLSLNISLLLDSLEEFLAAVRKKCR